MPLMEHLVVPPACITTGVALLRVAASDHHWWDARVDIIRSNQYGRSTWSWMIRYEAIFEKGAITLQSLPRRRPRPRRLAASPNRGWRMSELVGKIRNPSSNNER